MADFEQNTPDSQPGGVPDIPPEVVEAFKNISLNLDQSYNEAKESHATVVAWLQIEAEKRRLEPPQKRAFMLGALSVIGLYDFGKKYEQEIRPLEELLEQPPYTDKKHTDPPKTT